MMGDRLEIYSSNWAERDANDYVRALESEVASLRSELEAMQEHAAKRRLFWIDGMWATREPGQTYEEHDL